MDESNNKEIIHLKTEKRSQIEVRENIHILYACESGSRACGFACPDSDYDVRFVYIRPVQDYLRVKEQPDYIDAELNDVYDINGWDLKKFFKQLYKSNPVIFEWADSPIVYKTTPDWEKVKLVMKYYICKRSMIRHYLGLAKSTMKKYLTGETITYKKYFYILRAVLAASWVFYNDTWAPTEYSKLAGAEITSDDENDFEEMQNDLYEKKAFNSEKTAGKRNQGLECFINNRIAIINAGIQDVEKQDFDWEKLDQLFLDVVGGNNGRIFQHGFE